VSRGSTSGLEPLPSHTDRRVDADEEEERASEEGVDDGFIPYIRCDESSSPSQRDILDEGVDVVESRLFLNRRRDWRRDT
jgi:hypothetical protein